MAVTNARVSLSVLSDKLQRGSAGSAKTYINRCRDTAGGYINGWRKRFKRTCLV